MCIQLELIPISDAETYRQMQQRAFAELLERYRDYDTNPACETPARTRAKFTQPGRVYYYICHGDTRVGAISVVDPGTPARPKRISPLFILEEYRNRGYAQAAIREAERIHGEHSWALDTILEEPGNCHLYEKLGYRRIGAPQPVRPNMTIIDYEKD